MAEPKMAEPKKEPKVRIQLDLTSTQAERFDKLVRECDLSSRKELFNVAMSLVYWASKEVSRGRKIATFDEDSEQIETIIVPAFDNIARRTAVNKSSEQETAVEPRAKRQLEVVPAGGGVAAVIDER